MPVSRDPSSRLRTEVEWWKGWQILERHRQQRKARPEQPRPELVLTALVEPPGARRMIVMRGVPLVVVFGAALGVERALRGQKAMGAERISRIQA